MLHAGWPGGLVLGRLLAITLGEAAGWREKIVLLLGTVQIYTALLLRLPLPAHEHMSAGAAYRAMLVSRG